VCVSMSCNICCSAHNAKHSQALSCPLQLACVENGFCGILDAKLTVEDPALRTPVLSQLCLVFRSWACILYVGG